MNSGRKLHFWILVFLFVFSIEEAIDAYPQFTCGSHGIKHDINQTGDLPKVTCLTPSQTVYLDVNVQIACEVISSTYANITWLHNGKSLSEKKSLVKIDRLSCGQTLKIKFAGRDDRGQYTCVAANKFGTVNKTCSLNVTVKSCKPPPQVEYVKIDGNRQTAYLHGTVTLKCKLLHVAADAWLFNGTRVSHGGRHKMIREITIAKHERLFALKIINVTEKDEGRYTCLAYRSDISKTKDLVLKTEPCPSCHYCPPEGNQAFPICSSTSPIRLSTSDNDQDPKNKDIKHPPQVKYLKIDGKRQTAYLHGTVTLKCKLHHVEGEAWLFNGTRILHDDRHKMIRETTIGKHGGLFTLKIINVTEEDEGLYTCMGYRGGIYQTKDLFLKTEPCPRRHHCPPEGNQAFPISLLPSCNRGRSFHRPDPVSILLFAVLAFSSIKCV